MCGKLRRFWGLVSSYLYDEAIGLLLTLFLLNVSLLSFISRYAVLIELDGCLMYVVYVIFFLMSCSFLVTIVGFFYSAGQLQYIFLNLLPHDFFYFIQL